MRHEFLFHAFYAATMFALKRLDLAPARIAHPYTNGLRRHARGVLVPQGWRGFLFLIPLGAVLLATSFIAVGVASEAFLAPVLCSAVRGIIAGYRRHGRENPARVRPVGGRPTGQAEA